MRKNNIKIDGLFIQEWFYISRTGNLQQQYTLYRERTLSSECFFHNNIKFIQNLGIDFEKAKLNADTVINKMKTVEDPFIDIVESEKRVYNKFKAFNLQWKHNRKGYTAKPDAEFWTIWKEKK